MTGQLFDPFLYRALRKVARGEIGSISEHGALRHRSEDLSPRIFSWLFVLYRDGLIKLHTSRADPRDGWITAELTRPATSLLEDWRSACRRPVATRRRLLLPEPESAPNRCRIAMGAGAVGQERLAQ